MNPDPRTQPPSTYRLQITPEWDLAQAREAVAGIAELGAGWLYLSPLLRSVRGSAHGYDVVDHAHTDEQRGGSPALAELVATARSAGLGLLYDVVPNHMGVADPKQNRLWWELLRDGRFGRAAEFFDVDWAAGADRVLLPVLGDDPGELDALKLVDGELRYHDLRLPLAAGTAAGTGSARQVHARQHYELIGWRRGDRELNYRRFFTINDLAGLRVEVPEVFTASHAEIVRWLRAGWLDGLRIDHPDGLADPGGYLAALRNLIGDRYLVVEKILEPGERLPTSWDCQGTTGYEAGAEIDRLLVDPAGEPALDDLDTWLRGEPMDWAALVRRAKRAVADNSLSAEVARLARLAPDVPDAEDALAELLACFPVYRSYLPIGAEYLRQAVTAAEESRPDLAGSVHDLGRRLGVPGEPLAVRFQQTSGMVMAKGVEDCAFYRWSRLTSLTEVGADPAWFSLSPSDFHSRQADRLETWPATMTTLSTHDSKRSEDVRARINVLSETAADWAVHVRRWRDLVPLADGPLANLVWQAAVGAWPIERDRLQQYATKAAREAAVHTRWTDPDVEFEATLAALVDACYDHPVLSAELARLVARITPAGWSNSLSAKLIQLTAPGVPDVYQGTQGWVLALADPDNRRPVDHAGLTELLRRIDTGWQPEIGPDGAAKVLVTSRALRLRRDRPDLFTGYRPLLADGPRADHLVAFDRGGALTLATRLPVGLDRAGGWAGTTIDLPAGGWRDVLRGNESAVRRGRLPVAGLLSRYPVALLVKDEAA